MRSFRHISHHHHVEDVEFLGGIDEVAEGDIGCLLARLVDTFELHDQVLDAKVPLLVPIDQCVSERPFLLVVVVTGK